MVGCSWNFSFGGLQKFLISLIDKPGDFAADLDAGLGKETRGAVVTALNGCGNARFFYEDTVLCAGSFQNVKAMITEPIHGIFIRAFLCRCRHKPPDRRFDSKTLPRCCLGKQERIMSHMRSRSSNITVVQRVTPALRIRAEVNCKFKNIPALSCLLIV